MFNFGDRGDGDGRECVLRAAEMAWAGAFPPLEKEKDNEQRW